MNNSRPNSTKEDELRQKKKLALILWAIFFITFIFTLFFPPTFTTRLIKAGAEAAIIGGLADWFAVVALFKHPLGLRIPHTAIIPKSKNRIADNLADFVHEKFLNPQALEKLIKRIDPAQHFATWLTQPSNAKRVGRHTVDLISGWLDLVEERPIQAFIRDATHTVLGKLDFSQALGSVLEMLIKGGRHQHLLDTAIDFLVKKIREPELRRKVAERVVNWLKENHKIKQAFLPTDWIGDQAAEAASDGLNVFLQEIANSPAHELRKTFDQALRNFVIKLKTDEEFRRKGEEVKFYVQNNPHLTEYARSLWAALRDWISTDLESSSSQLQQQIEHIGLWFGQKLAKDDELRESINIHMQSLASGAAPQFAEFLTHHISDTMRKWDAEDMSRQIELTIGPDLQYIRINGTIVGCIIGLLLFTASYIVENITPFN